MTTRPGPIQLLFLSAFMTSAAFAQLDTVITEPRDVALTVEPGTIVNFQAEAQNETGSVTFIWQLWADGENQPRDEVEGQGAWELEFNEPGEYLVACAAQDERTVDETPAIVQVTVEESQAGPPETVILSPQGDQVIDQGTTLFFEVQTPDLSAGTINLIQYRWELKDSRGALLEFFTRQTFEYTFDELGKFTMTCTVTLNGVSDETPAMINIQVDEVAAFAPDTRITSPDGDQIIDVGDILRFEAVALLNDEPVQAQLLWELLDSTGQLIGNFEGDSFTYSFPEPGDYRMKCAAVVNDQADDTPDEIGITVNDTGNSTPPDTEIVAPIGDRQINVGDSLTFEAQAIAADGTAVQAAFSWQLVDGQGQVIDTWQDQRFTTDFPQAGTYAMRCAAELDGLTDPTPAEIFITVNDTGNNTPPDTEIVAPIGDQQINVGDSLSFEAQAIAADGTVVQATFSWQLVDGQGQVIDAWQDQRFTTDFPQAGTYAMRCAAELDGQIDPAPAEIFITVNDNGNNTPPDTEIVAPKGDQQINVGDSLSFEAQAIAADGTVVQATFSWQLVDGQGQVIDAWQDQRFTTDFPRAGTYAMRCAAELDGQIDPTPAEVFITVEDDNTGQEPDTRIVTPKGDITLAAGDTQTFEAEAITADAAQQAAFNWLLVDQATGAELAAWTGRSITVGFDEPGAFIMYCAAEVNGVQDSTPAQRGIVVEANGGGLPDTIIVEPPEDLQVNVGQEVRFLAAATNVSDEPGAQFFWELWDDTGQKIGEWETETFAYTFDRPGNFIMYCAAVSSAGSDDTPAERRITVLDDNTGGNPPDTFIVEPAEDLAIETGTEVYFEATTDDPNAAAEFLWELLDERDQRLEASDQKSPTFTFYQPGTFTVTCRATVNGVTDPTPDERNITVSGAGSGNEPDTVIIEPQDDVTIDPGEAVFFEAVTGDGDTQADFLWELRDELGRIVDVFDQQSFEYRFNDPGFFLITCAAAVNGVRDQSPDLRTISVGNGGNTGGEVETFIVSPQEPVVTIEPGEEIYFEAEAYPAKKAEIDYLWELTSADGQVIGTWTEASFKQLFPESGSFVMTCTAQIDGVADPTPARVDIGVLSENPPDTVIDMPETDQVVDVGSLLTFSASSPANEAVDFYWEIYDTNAPDYPRYFEGRRIDVDFPEPGIFLVGCAGKNRFGMDETPAQLMVTVNARAGRVETLIVEPQGAGARVQPGDTLNFRAEVKGDGQWDQVDWALIGLNAAGDEQSFFGEEISITFDTPGYFELYAVAVLDGKEVDPTPAEFEIEVLGEDIFAEIVKPEDLDISAGVGETIQFQGEVIGVAPEEAAWFTESDDGSLEPIATGTELSYTFNEPGDYFIAFAAGIPTEDEENIDFRFIKVREEGEHDVRITSPVNGQEVAVGEIFTLQGEVLGIDPADTSLIWQVGDQTYLGATVPNVSVTNDDDVAVTLFSTSEKFGDAFDVVFLEVYDPTAPLIAEIEEPETNLTIPPGETVYFEGFFEGDRASEEIGVEWWIDDEQGTRLFTGTELGNHRFDNAGTFTVTYVVRSDQRDQVTDVRTIKVQTADQLGIENNFDLDNAWPLDAGSYNGLDISQEEYYSFVISKPDRTLAFEFSGDGAATIEVLSATGTVLRSEKIESGDGFAAGFVVQGLAPGTYILHIIPESAGKGKAGLNMSFGVSVLAPSLFFPDIQADGKYISDVGIVNPNGNDASVKLVGYDSAGNILEEKSYTIGSMGKLSGPVTNFFTKASDIDWISVSADRGINGYAHTSDNSGAESFAMTAPKYLEQRLYVPHIAAITGTWSTEASVINGSSDTANAVLSNQFVQDVNLSNNTAFSRDDFDFGKKYGGAVPETVEWVRLEENDSQLLMAGHEIFRTVDGSNQTAGLTLDNVGKPNPNFTYVDNNIYFTHIARDTATFWTGLALVNINDIPTGIKIIGWGDGGVKIGEMTRTLEAGDKLVGSATNLLADIGTPAQIAWVEVQADEPIVGYELFGTTNAKRLAGFEASTALKRELVFPYLAPTTDWHGISVINVNDEPANLNMTIYSSTGTVVATAQAALLAREKKSAPIESLFGLTTLPNNAAWLYISSDKSIAGFQLFGRGDDQMAALIAD
ncbi:MAG: hypothetical protein QNK37_15150 [Acidobacteriota bacterium]|nr:hypothetical protein [Acidobacteriota bacterium]